MTRQRLLRVSFNQWDILVLFQSVVVREHLFLSLMASDNVALNLVMTYCFALKKRKHS